MAIYNPTAIILTNLNATSASETYEKRVFEITTCSYMVFSMG